MGSSSSRRCRSTRRHAVSTLAAPVEGLGPRLVSVAHGRNGRARRDDQSRRAFRRSELADSLPAATSCALTRIFTLLRAGALDPDLAWVVSGAGRMVRSQTVFEERGRENGLHDELRLVCDRADGRCPRGAPGRSGTRGEDTEPFGRAFPTPEAMAEAGESFYRDTVRAGYRGAYLRSLASSVADGSVDLEELGQTTREELSDDEVEARLLALPGVGPHAAAHIMMMLGRYSRLILDSWTRPKYAAVTGGRPKKDTTIIRRFRRYGPTRAWRSGSC